MSKHTLAKAHSIRRRWRGALKQPEFLVETLLTLLILTLSLYLLKAVMQYAHTRPGATLDDPILRAFGPVLLRWPIFLVLWSSLLTGLYALAKIPARLVMFLQASTLLTFFNALALYLTPLEPRTTIIPLADPVATLRTEAGSLILNDLFFSGHTATMFLLVLAAPSKRLKRFFVAGFVFIGLSVVLQHVHYSIDVFAAPFFAYGSWGVVLHIQKRFKESTSS